MRTSPPRVLLVCAIGAMLAVPAPSPSAQTAAPAAVTIHLDQFLRGEFASTDAALAATRDFDALLDALRRDGKAWVGAGVAEEIPRRRLAAATFALEAALAAERVLDWKWVQRINLNQVWARPETGDGPAPRLPQTYRAPDAIWWKTPPLLIEWGCALMRATDAASPAERFWHLAALAVAQHAGDYEFLVGSVFEDRGNPQDEIEHLTHALTRFPDEPRFALAQAVAVEWYTWPTQPDRPRARARNIADAVRAFHGMLRDEWIGPEATLRTGFLLLRDGRPGSALEHLARVEQGTRDPFLLYLAHYFRGVALERTGTPGDAESAYRTALAIVPGAQSAAMALAARLHATGRRREATALVEATLALTPPPVDPWRAYGAADARFWPELRARLHAAITAAAPDGGAP